MCVWQEERRWRGDPAHLPFLCNSLSTLAVGRYRRWATTEPSSQLPLSCIWAAALERPSLPPLTFCFIHGLWGFINAGLCPWHYQSFGLDHILHVHSTHCFISNQGKGSRAKRCPYSTLPPLSGVKPTYHGEVHRVDLGFLRRLKSGCCSGASWSWAGELMTIFQSSFIAQSWSHYYRRKWCLKAKI